MDLLMVFCLLVNLNYCFGKGLKVYYNVTDEEYNSMPKLFELDDFDSCMSLKQPSLYCYATIQLSPRDPEAPTKIWNIIKEVTSVPRTYRHDRLRHGVCVPKACPGIPRGLYKTGNGTEELRKALSECYTNKYSGLELSCDVTKLQCQDQRPQYETDNVDFFFAFIIGIMLFFVALGTVYDTYSPQGESVEKSRTFIHQTLLKHFSIVSNWKKFTRIDEVSENAATFRPLQGVKVYNTFFVIFSHTVMTMASVPVYNEKYFEDTTLKTENMFASNGSLICQTFFFISAFSLSHSFKCVFREKKIKVGDLVFAFVYRFFRLALMLLLAVGFSATWLRHLGNGPFWDHAIQNEFRNCRKNWWANLLFVNNLYGTNEMCLQQTWYLAVDSQLFILGLIVMYFVVNNQKRAKCIFVAFTVVSLLVSVAHNYYLDVDIVFRSYSEIMYASYLEYEQWTGVFVLPQYVVPSYVHGLACGYYVHHLKQRKRLLFENRILDAIQVILQWTVPITTTLIAIQFYKEGYEHDRLKAALYQGLNRYVFCFFIGTFLLAAASGKNGLTERVCKLRPVQILAKLQYSVLLIHIWPMRILYGSARTGAYISDFKIFVDTMAFTSIAIIFGTFVHLCFEMPLSGIQKTAMKIEERKTDTKDKRQ